MNKIKTIFIALILAIVFTGIIETVKVQADVAGFRADLASAFTNNFTAQQRSDIANSFVAAYQAEWTRGVALGTYTNNATGRGNFTLDKIIGYIREVHHSEQRKTDLSSVPTPTPLP